MDKLLLLGVALACLAPAVLSQQRSRSDKPVFQWSVHDYPDPFSYDTYSRCGRYNKSNICDPNNLIPREKSDKIDKLIWTVFHETRCGCHKCIQNKHGFVIRVAVMPRMESIFKKENTSENLLKDAQMFAYMLTQKWAMGGSCNESVLILFSRYDNVLYTVTLPLARGILKDEYVKRITIVVRHLFDNDDTIGDGLYELIERYMMIFENKKSKAFRPVASAQRSSDGISVIPSVAMTFLLTLGLMTLKL
ncbi:hypothetical protein ACOMHN_028957 [Nucella lapillus]